MNRLIDLFLISLVLAVLLALVYGYTAICETRTETQRWCTISMQECVNQQGIASCVGR